MAVKTELQRQHISKALIEYGLQRARELGYKAVIVEGNPMNYCSRGFVTSADYGITAHESVGLSAPECLMARELVPGGLDGIHGEVCYADYSVCGKYRKIGNVFSLGLCYDLCVATNLFERRGTIWTIEPSFKIALTISKKI